MSRQKKQKLFYKIDEMVYRLVEKNPNIKLVVRHLSRFVDGTETNYNNWVFEHPVYIKSRLIKKWFEMSMDLSF